MLTFAKEYLHQHDEKIGSIISYGIGGGAASYAWVVDRAQDLTILIGLLIVAMRLIYDAVKLWRYLVSNRP